MLREVLIHAVKLKEKNTIAAGSTGTTSYTVSVKEDNLNPDYLCKYAWQQGTVLTQFEIINDEPSIDLCEDIVLALNDSKKIIVSPSMANVKHTCELEDIVSELITEMNDVPVIDLDNITYKAKYSKLGNGFLIEEYGVQG